MCINVEFPVSYAESDVDLFLDNILMTKHFALLDVHKHVRLANNYTLWVLPIHGGTFEGGTFTGF